MDGDGYTTRITAAIRRDAFQIKIHLIHRYCEIAAERRSFSTPNHDEISARLNGRDGELLVRRCGAGDVIEIATRGQPIAGDVELSDAASRRRIERQRGRRTSGCHELKV